MAVWLNETDVRACLPMASLVPAMEKALAAFSAGEVKQPVRNVIEVDRNSFFATMPAYAPGFPTMGAKLVTVFGANSERGLPSHLANILLLDPENRCAARRHGRPLHYRSSDGSGVRRGCRVVREGGFENSRNSRIRRAGSQPS